MLELLPALIPVLTAVVSFVTGPGRRRRALRHDVETAAALPAGSEAKKLMDTVVERQVRELHSFLGGQRQVGFAVMATVATAGLLYVAVYSIGRGGWWILAAVVALLVSLPFIFGIFDSGRRLPRDERGRTVRETADAGATNKRRT